MSYVTDKTSSIADKCLIISSVFTYIGAMYLTKYGGDDLWEKAKGRFLSGLVVGVASLMIALSVQSWTLLSAQVSISVLAHLVFGLTNPLKAPHEELLISFLTVLLVPFMVI
jgi:multisubunit Na+/H+ antiporter MnhG subunit